MHRFVFIPLGNLLCCSTFLRMNNISKRRRVVQKLKLFIFVLHWNEYEDPKNRSNRKIIQQLLTTLQRCVSVVRILSTAISNKFASVWWSIRADGGHAIFHRRIDWTETQNRSSSSSSSSYSWRVINELSVHLCVTNTCIMDVTRLKVTLISEMS